MRQLFVIYFCLFGFWFIIIIYNSVRRLFGVHFLYSVMYRCIAITLTHNNKVWFILTCYTVVHIIMPISVLLFKINKITNQKLVLCLKILKLWLMMQSSAWVHDRGKKIKIQQKPRSKSSTLMISLPADWFVFCFSSLVLSGSLWVTLPALKIPRCDKKVETLSKNRTGRSGICVIKSGKEKKHISCP